MQKNEWPVFPFSVEASTKTIQLKRNEKTDTFMYYFVLLPGIASRLFAFAELIVCFRSFTLAISSLRSYLGACSFVQHFNLKRMEAHSELTAKNTNK